MILVCTRLEGGGSVGEQDGQTVEDGVLKVAGGTEDGWGGGGRGELERAVAGGADEPFKVLLGEGADGRRCGGHGVILEQVCGALGGAGAIPSK